MATHRKLLCRLFGHKWAKSDYLFYCKRCTWFQNWQIYWSDLSPRQQIENSRAYLASKLSSNNEATE